MFHPQGRDVAQGDACESVFVANEMGLTDLLEDNHVGLMIGERPNPPVRAGRRIPGHVPRNEAQHAGEAYANGLARGRSKSWQSGPLRLGSECADVP